MVMLPRNVPGKTDQQKVRVFRGLSTNKIFKLADTLEMLILHQADFRP
jgi:hypothetical protein